jgi:hypothetical protein
MRVAIVSDIHDHVWRLAGVLAHASDCEAMVCCGDLCSPFVIAQLAEGFEGALHVVFGNNDGDRFTISSVLICFLRWPLRGGLAHRRAREAGSGSPTKMTDFAQPFLGAASGDSNSGRIGEREAPSNGGATAALSHKGSSPLEVLLRYLSNE